MALLLLHEQPLDWNKEVELTNNSEFGFNCIIKYKEGSVSHMCNLHEIHHRYNQNKNADSKDIRSAFESDHHCTGATRSINEIDYIIIYDAKQIHKYFYDND